jgi:FSR family fosmidomycin resistance protein-like MFS transporter
MNIKALLLLIAGHFAIDILMGALPAFLPFVKESLRLSYFMTASIILVYNVTASIIQPAFGYWSDRSQARWFLPLGCFIAPMGLGLLGYAPSYAWILTLVAISGFGQASFHPEAFKTVNFLSGQKKATAFSFFHLGGGAGFALGPVLATLFYSHLGLKGSTLFMIPGFVLLVIFLTTSFWKVEQPLAAGRGLQRRGATPFQGRPASMAFLLLAVVLRSASRLGLVTFLPFYFIQILKQDPLLAGQYLSAFLFAGNVGIAAGGPLADRFGYKRTVLLSFALTPVFLFFFFFTRGTLSFFFLIAAGVTIISSNAVTMAIGQSLMPRNLGMAAGLVLGMSLGFGGIATTSFGWVADRWGLPLTLQMIFILPLLAFLIFLQVPDPLRSAQRSESEVRSEGPGENRHPSPPI